jgi:hypothetical protein
MTNSGKPRTPLVILIGVSVSALIWGVGYLFRIPFLYNIGVISFTVLMIGMRLSSVRNTLFSSDRIRTFDLTIDKRGRRIFIAVGVFLFVATIASFGVVLVADQNSDYAVAFLYAGTGFGFALSLYLGLLFVLPWK